MTDGLTRGVPVWVLLIERGIEDGSDLRLFWQRDQAEAAARDYLAEGWLNDPGLPPDTYDAIEQHNGDPTAAERVFLGQVRIEGDRSRCRLCGEPIVLDEEDDPDSWVHAEDANDGADHTAEFRSSPSQPKRRGIA